MKKFIKNIIYFLLPITCIVTALLSLYYIADPYDDFKVKENYSWKFRFQKLGDLSTKKLMHTTQHYNSFVLGSSRSCGVYACYLEQKIPHSKFYHYANWNETIGGIEQKLKLALKQGHDLKNVVIYIDNDCTFLKKGKVRTTDHYLLTKQNRIKYVLKHLLFFFKNLDADLIKILLGMGHNITDAPFWNSDLNTNDVNHICNDSIKASYGVVLKDKAHLTKVDSLLALNILYKRPTTQQYNQPKISANEKKSLQEIKALFDKHNTQYYIVLTPLYNQEKISTVDLEILKSYFGDGLYDFSGINAFTNNAYNYVDKEHFQPYVSKSILDSIIKH